MHKIKLSWKKTPLITFLSLGFMVVGIGCIAWAIFSIWAPIKYSVAAAPSSNLSPSIKTESKPSIVAPTPSDPLYSAYPAEGDNIGSLTIPALKRKITILQGTEEKELKKGVGHFLQSVLPGEGDNCVLSGHRDTVFREIGNLKIGDQLIVETVAGVFTYEVKGKRIVHADDKTVIVPTPNAVLTMTTCYPFYAIGNAPDRYIVSADLVKSEQVNKE
jgi:sortase A